MESFSQDSLRSLFTISIRLSSEELIKLVCSIPLTKTAKEIARKEIREWVKNAEEMYSLKIDVAKDFAEKIIEGEFSITEGARPLERRIKSNLEKSVNESLAIGSRREERR